MAWTASSTVKYVGEEKEFFPGVRNNEQSRNAGVIYRPSCKTT